MESQSQRLKTKYITQKCGACIADSLFMKCCKFAKLKLEDNLTKQLKQTALAKVF